MKAKQRTRVWSPRHRAGRALAAALLIGAGLACESEPVATGPDDDVAVGLRVHLNGALVARVNGTTVEGLLHAHVGEYSGTFIVTAINGAGNTIDEPGTFRLGAETLDPAVASFVQPTAGALEGEIVATAGGLTHLMLSLWRGEPGSGAAAFTAPPIEVLALVCAGAGLESVSIRTPESVWTTTSPSMTTCAPSGRRDRIVPFVSHR